MRIGAIYDIHGNLPALEAVLEDMEGEGVDHVVVGGDVVAGPFPVQSLRLLRELPVPTHFILGNAESELLRCAAGGNPGGLSERADEEAKWLAQRLSSEQLNFLSSWPATVEFDTKSQGRILFCHATPDSDTRIFTSRTPETEIAPSFNGLSASLVVCGHTHISFGRTVAGIRVVNAGSVGMPFGRTGADWLLIDSAVEHKHTDYDVTLAAERIRGTDYPYATVFADSSVVRPPSEAEALDMLSRLEMSRVK